MRNIYLTQATLTAAPTSLAATPWRSQIPFALVVLAALGLAWLA
jgi:hypothetical protein